MIYKVKNKITLNKKLVKCDFKLTKWVKCYNEGNILYNNENICNYHYNYYIIGKNCNGCGLNQDICLCKKDLNILNFNNSSDEDYESDNEESDKEPPD
jgi:hypothetical protein